MLVDAGQRHAIVDEQVPVVLRKLRRNHQQSVRLSLSKILVRLRDSHTFLSDFSGPILITFAI